MKLQNYFYAAALLGLTAFASCKKDDSNDPGPSSGNLQPGKSAITFNTDANFGGKTTFNPSAPTFTSAVRQASGSGYDNITLTVTDVDYSDISNVVSKTGQLTILLASNSSTTSGSLNANFSNTASNDILPVFTISSTRGTSGSNTEAYSSETGNVTITKLTSTEIEGTFSGHLINEDQGTSINVNNGKFAGKFQ